MWGSKTNSQSTFQKTGAGEDDKTDETQFFQKKGVLPDKQLIIFFPIQTTKYWKEKLFAWCVDNNVSKIIDDVFCLNCNDEKSAYN